MDNFEYEKKYFITLADLNKNSISLAGLANEPAEPMQCND